MVGSKAGDRKFRIVRTVAEFREQVSAWHRNDLRVGFVPTMGALHVGHMSLIRRAQEMTDRTVASIFVNPRQFGPNEDFAVYPRAEDKDTLLLAEGGVDLLFAPSVEEMYPGGAVTKVSVPGIGDILEGEYRPGFFTGVATVVTKLLLQAQPDVAVFGEKDYQQLLVIRRMVQDLDIPVQIEGAPTEREDDGLACSSRNQYLTENERAVAPQLYQIINAVAERYRKGERPPELTHWGKQALLDAGFGHVDYLEVRDAETLQGLSDPARAARVLVAAWLGKPRLIDNVPV
ncbi:MAG: pantoate--beta-alanine ligase [Rhodospirillales bacterium]|nr:pantoate--beta-alanine ligase [Rhodospirillales bacterium]MCW8951591.1 pantoate--beta-alanine ligase [Rhodospirillales bacterium]MCW8970524.1 pantoate--beta-alanine ligase [Rhodospirillales bacterium]MCW9002594.1 pantoate--beta-alanine ligase [Rhodospirillales bacterium]